MVLKMADKSVGFKPELNDLELFGKPIFKLKQPNFLESDMIEG